MGLHIGDYKGSIAMNNKLLVKNILCALSIGVIINFNTIDTAFANEKNGNEIQQVDKVNTQQEQLEQIQQLSKDIADINIRLNQLTESLNKYNENLKQDNENINIVDNKEEFSSKDIEEFNNNRKLDKKSRIVQEDESDWQKDFNKNNVSDVSNSTKEIDEKTLSNDNEIIENMEQDEFDDVVNDFGERNKNYEINYEFNNNNEIEVDDNYNEISKMKDGYNGKNINNENIDEYEESDNKIVKNEVEKKGDNEYSNTIDTIDVNEEKYITDYEDDINDKKDVIELDNVHDDFRTKNYMLNLDKNDENIKDTNTKGEKNYINNDKRNISDTSFNINKVENINTKDISNINNKRNKERKISIENNYMVNMDSDNFVNLDSMNMLDRFNTNAPLWTYEYFERLSTKGLLYPDKNFNLSALNRREAAILTARSYNLNKIKQRRQQYETNTIKQKDEFVSKYIDMLMREFYPEVKALGYDIVSEVTNTNIQYKQDYEWKIGGEIRYDYAKNSGSPKYEWNDSRLRIRLYGEKALSEDWILHTMLESDKSFIDDSIYTQERDGDIELNRLYLETNQEWWGIPFNFEIGKTYAYLGDGNILDSDFKGVRVSAEATQDTNYSLGYGKVNDTEDMLYAEILNRNKDYDYLAGIYKWDNYGNSDIIKAFGMNYYTGNYTFGGMYLTSDLKDGSGADDGYVLSARYGRNISWIPHTFEFDIKYYNMAGHTYINPTMSGLGGYMDGFSGWGTMAYYTLAENLVLGLEYYDLEDKTTSEKGKTVWASLIYGF